MAYLKLSEPVRFSLKFSPLIDHERDVLVVVLTKGKNTTAAWVLRC